jgi:hypothetical protein
MLPDLEKNRKAIKKSMKPGLFPPLDYSHPVVEILVHGACPNSIKG